jgi:hypothetical protein
MKIYEAGERAPYPADWPPQEYFVEPSRVVDAVHRAFSELLSDGASETDADLFLRANPAVLGQCLNFTQFGHHGMWVLPQKLIDPGASSIRRGLKPDFVFGGKSSDGFSWYVAELKGPQDKIFKRTGSDGRVISLSSTVSEGVCQLLQYMDYCSAQQAYIRDHLRLTNFREPIGFLVVGRDDELECDEQLQALKSSWNRMSGGRVQIRTYDALLRSNSSSWIPEEQPPSRQNWTP